MNRNEKLLSGVNLSRAKGMEIGALDKPVIPPDSPGVFYVDHMPTEGLREKYATDASVQIENLVHVSGVWGERTLAQITESVAPFDFIVASHVIEHVPDLITWLAELGSVLRDAGEVRLAIPDRRYTFDYLRKETEPADVLDAWIRGARVPQTRAILDFALHFADNDCLGAWQPGFDGSGLKPRHTPESAIACGRAALADGEYNDVHCWVFTPVSFARLMAQLGSYGAIGFKCANFFDTPSHTFEFFVTMQKSSDVREIVASWAEMQRQLEEKQRATAQAMLSKYETEGASAKELLAKEREIEALKADIEKKKTELEKIERSSSWKVTAPLRAVRRWLGRGEL
jgi:SAM-dependent methyltransferase